MITGRVINRHALLPVIFRQPDAADLSIEFVVDTGFTGFLTLPPPVVEALQLSYLEDISANLANDSTVAIAVHVATIVWNGVQRDVRVLATGRRPLIGTALLDGHVLMAQFIEDGLVSVSDLVQNRS